MSKGALLNHAPSPPKPSETIATDTIQRAEEFLRTLGGRSSTVIIPGREDHRARLERIVREIEEKAVPDNTSRAYEGDERCLSRCCADLEIPDPYGLGARDILTFVAYELERGCSLSTVTRRLSGIRHAYKKRSKPFPMTFREQSIYLARIQNELAALDNSRPLQLPKRKRIYEDGVLAKILATFDVETPRGARNHAIVSNSAWGAFRRSEIAGMRCNQRVLAERGHTFILTHSKTNQTGHVNHVHIPYRSDPITCPVRSMNRHLKMSRFEEGPIFRGIDRWGHVRDTALTAPVVALIIKQALRDIGMSEDDVAHYSGHSSRRWWVTKALRAGIPRYVVKTHARIRREDTVDVYTDWGDTWKHDPSELVL